MGTIKEQGKAKKEPALMEIFKLKWTKINVSPAAAPPSLLPSFLLRPFGVALHLLHKANTLAAACASYVRSFCVVDAAAAAAAT